MKNILKLLAASFITIVFFAACNKTDNLKKVESLPVYADGISPVLSSSVASVAPTLADSNNVVITFSWTDPKYATDLSHTKYILTIDSTNKSFGAVNNTKTVVGALSTTMTGRELNAYLLNIGFKVGVEQSIDLILTSSYANNNQRYLSNVITVKVKPFADPSVLFTQNTSVTCQLATASSPSNTFSWTPTFKGFTGVVNYTLQYDSAGKNFVAPQEVNINSDLSKTFTQGQMNDISFASGIPYGNNGKVEFRVKGVTANGTTLYSNVVNVTIQSYVPILRLYLPGGYQASTGNGNNWDPGTAPELIRDLRSAVFNKMYYIYIYLPAGSEFKVTAGRSWDVNYGGSGGVLSQNGANFSVASSGYYRVSVNVSNLTYNIMQGRMGFVGGATGAGWNPPGVFPNYALGNAGTNLFVGLTDFTSGGWKLIDNDQWNNGSNTVGETRSYGSTGGDGSTLEVNGTNFNDFATPGRYRVIWDGRDRDNVKYFASPASEMRVVGDGITGVPAWNPGASPQMTYMGNGIWTKTLDLEANKDIKFLAGANWGAFDYEDNSGGSQSVGTPRAIKWEGGPNFKTPATAGTYTITLNENLQTVTIN